MNILLAYGMPSKIVQSIRNVYSHTKATVLTADGETDTFNIGTGVLRGDTLAPYLFVIALDYALRRSIDRQEEELGFTIHPRRGRRVGPCVITDLDSLFKLKNLPQKDFVPFFKR